MRSPELATQQATASVPHPPVTLVARLAAIAAAADAARRGVGAVPDGDAPHPVPPGARVAEADHPGQAGVLVADAVCPADAGGAGDGDRPVAPGARSADAGAAVDTRGVTAADSGHPARIGAGRTGVGGPGVGNADTPAAPGARSAPEPGVGRGDAGPPVAPGVRSAPELGVGPADAGPSVGPGARGASGPVGVGGPGVGNADTPAAPGARSGCGGGGYAVLAERPDATVVRVGETVAKAHPVDTVAADLAVRLEVATHPRLRTILLRPHAVRAEVEGRPVTVWPYGAPVDAGDPGAAPWEEAAVLLARLHVVPPDALPGPLPPMRGPAKAAAAVARLDGLPRSEAVATVRRAWRLLPGWATGGAPHEGPRALCHGDWHLGQLVRHPAPGGRWLLIDVDDLGAGDPAWDLARPAMWFAAGLLAPPIWAGFLAAYRAAGGTAVPADGDPWARLDVPARTLAVQTAAVAVAKAARESRDLDEAEAGVLAACARIAGLSR